MNRIRTIRRLACLLAGLATTLFTAATAPAAFASADRPPPMNAPARPAPTPPPVHTVVAGGMPGWQIALIAAGVAILTAALAVTLDRARAYRRHLAAPSA